PRYFFGAELDRVGDEPERRARRPDPRTPADVLLEDVVLDRPPQLRPVDAALLGCGDVEREDDRRGPVDREARADGIERDLIEQDFDVGERVERDTDPAHLLFDVWVVRVVTALGGKVECDREPRPTLLEKIAVARVGLLGSAEPRVLAEGPQPAPVAVREVPAREGERAERRERLRRGGGAPARSRP